MNDQQIKQQLFERIFKGLAAQLWRQSWTSASGCLYRHKGLKCAIGQLIDDQHYSPQLENKTIGDSIVLEAVEASVGFKLTSAAIYFLDDLQIAHDEGGPGMKKRLLAVAEGYGIEVAQ